MGSEVEDAWVEVLKSIYMAVDWWKVARNHRSEDIFQHRVRFASVEPDIPSVIEKLCNSLSLQAPRMPADRIDFLRQHEKEALKVLRKRTRLLTLYASVKAREEWKARKKEKKKVEE